MRFKSKPVAISIAEDSVFFAKQGELPIEIPAYCIVAKETNEIFAIGGEAKQALGNTPPNIIATSPLKEGYIADFEQMNSIFRYGIQQLGIKSIFKSPCLIAGRFADLDIAARAVQDSIERTHAFSSIYLLEHSMASAIGAKLPVSEPTISPILSFNDNWCEFAVISLSGIIESWSLPLGLNTIIDDIRCYLTQKIGVKAERSAIKETLFSKGLTNTSTIKITGWESWANTTETGRYMNSTIDSETILPAMTPFIMRICEAIRDTLNSLSNDQQVSIKSNGLTICGKTSLIPRLSTLLSNYLGLKVTTFEMEHHPSIFGALEVLDSMKELQKALK